MDWQLVFTIALGVALGMLGFVIVAAALFAIGAVVWFLVRLSQVTK